jgi:F0F1-type ATP synthase delta subunit
MENILEEIKTTEDRDRLLEEVDLLLISLFKKQDNTFDSVMQGKVRIRIANAIMSEIASEGINKEEFLKELKQKAENMNIIKFILAYDPPYSSVKVFSNFVKKTLDKTLLIEFQYDPDIIAGAKIIYNGRYIDLSVTESFNQTLESLQKKTVL